MLENGREGSQKRHREREKYGPPLDPEDSERLKAIEQGVIEACKPSTYNESQKKRLHMAVSMYGLVSLFIICYGFCRSSLSFFLRQNFHIILC